jgi:uncharacterized protein
VELVEVSGLLWVSRLDAGADIAMRGEASFFSVTRTADEVSVVGPQPQDGARAEGPWRGFRVAGVLDFSLTGVLHALTGPLSAAGISVFVQSTFDTDYILVREELAAAAVNAWIAAGYTVTASSV